jgi:hypothetical protein
MAYEFLSSSYPTASDLCVAIASTWLSGSGLADLERMRAFLADATDGELADDAIDGLRLSGSWMEERGIERGDVAAGFARVREQCAVSAVPTRHR